MSGGTKIIPIIIAIVWSVLVVYLLIWRESNGYEASASRFVEHNLPYLVSVKSPPGREAMFVIVTAYSSTIAQTDSSPYLTAHQTLVDENTIACPRYLAFHTKVVIQGKEYECLDRMNIRYKDRFDLWFPTKGLADQWGIRELEVIIR